jgi:hypothetical protein
MSEMQQNNSNKEKSPPKIGPFLNTDRPNNTKYMLRKGRQHSVLGVETMRWTSEGSEIESR